jgi:RHS repeat-associated protein
VGGLLQVSVLLPSPFTLLPSYDGNGNILCLVDSATGTTAAQYEYGPFGEPVKVTGSAAALNPFRFSTKYTDSETGLLYYGYRYYSPSMRRWLSRDPIEEQGGVNLYGMVGNDPINAVDFLGLLSCDELIEKYLEYANLVIAPYVAKGAFTESKDAIMAGAVIAAVNGGDYYYKPWSSVSGYYEKGGVVDMYSTKEYAWTAEKVDGGWQPNRARTNKYDAQVELRKYNDPLYDSLKVYRGEMEVAHNHPPDRTSNGDPEVMSGYGLMVQKVRSANWGGDHGEAGYLKVLQVRNGRVFENQSFYMVSPTGRLYHGTLDKYGNPTVEEVYGLILSGQDFNDLICCLRKRNGK